MIGSTVFANALDKPSMKPIGVPISSASV